MKKLVTGLTRKENGKFQQVLRMGVERRPWVTRVRISYFLPNEPFSYVRYVTYLFFPWKIHEFIPRFFETETKKVIAWGRERVFSSLLKKGRENLKIFCRK